MAQNQLFHLDLDEDVDATEIAGHDGFVFLRNYRLSAYIGISHAAMDLFAKKWQEHRNADTQRSGDTRLPV